MKYYTGCKVQEDYTTKAIRGIDVPDKVIYYEVFIGEKGVYGVTSEDYTKFINEQYPACDASEVQFSEISELLKTCRIYNDINLQVATRIATKYDFASELGLTNSDHATEGYIAYRAFVGECKAWGTGLKRDMGLVE
jgi:hypothetical protein